VSEGWLLSREDLAPGFEAPKCHAATLAQTTDGLLVAYFGGADFGAAQDIWLLRKNARGWEAARRIAAARARPDACWNPVLHQIPRGPLLLFFKQGPDCVNWSGMLARSSDAGRTWTPPVRLPSGVYGPIRSRPTALPDGSLLCPSSTERGAWRVHFERTNDQGRTWTRTPDVAAPPGVDAIQPTILAWPDGRLQALCRTQRSGIVETTSSDGGATWTELRAIHLPNPNSGIEGLVLRDGRALLLYNPTSTPAGNWCGPRTPLSLAVSRDGRTWDRVGDVDDAPEELSYPAAIQTADGRVHVAYTAGDGWSGMRHAVIDPTAIPNGR
jgi:predicted neuraminidase